MEGIFNNYKFHIHGMNLFQYIYRFKCDDNFTGIVSEKTVRQGIPHM